MTPEIWTLEDVAKFLRVSAEAAEKLVKESKIPHFRVGDAIRFRKDQIIRMTESGTSSHSDALIPHSHSERWRGRTEWRMSSDKQELFVRLGNPLSFPRLYRHLTKEENDAIGGPHEHQDSTAVHGRV